jgi:hypothetical protein
MRLFLNRLFLAATLAVSACIGFAQPDTARPPGMPSDANVIAFGRRAEEALQAELPSYTPLAEGYIQQFAPTEKGLYVLNRDLYLLGRLTWSHGPGIDDLLHDGESADAKSADGQHLLDALPQVMVPDWKQLTPDRYAYSFVGTEFLGSIRCFVYDLQPLHAEPEGFAGRIYLEDRTFNIVRFTGKSPRVDALLAPLRNAPSVFHLDAWRVNVSKSHWVPAYVYVEEVPALDAPAQQLMRGQIRFWAYDRTSAQRQQEFVDLIVSQSASAVEGRKQQQPSPQQIERMFENQAEDNVLARLLLAGFLGTPGEVEKSLDQVLNNLVISNKLVLAQPLRCRVLLTAPLESFTVGRSLVFSRELINVLPSESALALIIAHQLAHHALGHRRVDMKLAFPDVLKISDAELLAKLKFRHTTAEEADADRLALQLLEQSPYSKAMESAGLFMQAVQSRAAQLSALISPRFGEHIADTEHAVERHPITRLVPLDEPQVPTQVAALPLGSHVVVNTWNGRMEFFRPDPVVKPAPYERNDLAVTHLYPLLDYAAEKPVARPSNAASQPPADRPRTPAVRSVTPASAPAVKPSTPQKPQARAKEVAAIPK